MEITQAQKYEILEHELLNGAGLVLLYGVATEMNCYNYSITAFVREQRHFKAKKI